MNHFSLAFKSYIEKDLNIKACFFFGNQILADMKANFENNENCEIPFPVTNLKALNIIWSFTIIYKNLIERNHDYMKT